MHREGAGSQTIFFELASTKTGIVYPLEMKRLGILTSGGDAPGMNAVVRATVRTATAHGVTVSGYLDGYTGFVAGEFVELDDRAVGNIIQRGGTILGTSRCAEFLDPAVRKAAAEQMRAKGIDGLLTVGGDGTLRGALE